MLRNRPNPPGPVCLSIDPGTQNTGICLFDSTTQAIIYWGRHKLLDEHEQVVTSTDQIKRHLDDITAVVEATLQGRDYWVLIEQQPWDSEAKSGIIFPAQLQQAIFMYYLMKDKLVRLIDARARFTFLNIKDWTKSTRYHRKTTVTNKIKQLLSQEYPANKFASADHHLATWRVHKENQHDMADSLAQVKANLQKLLLQLAIDFPDLFPKRRK
eukprot:gene1150-1489_t